jgi:hypothetical protein
VGSFLKTELFRGSSESDVAINTPQLVKAHLRDRKDKFNSMDKDLFQPFNLTDPTLSRQMYSEQLQRRQSKGKKLISKAFDKFGNARSKSMHFVRSKSSTDSLLRQVSPRNLGSPRPISSVATSRNASRFSFEEESICIANSSSISVVSADAPTSALTSPFILYPEIIIVPEVGSVDVCDEASIWVAVVVTGALHNTGGNSGTPDALFALDSGGIRQDGMTSGS